MSEYLSGEQHRAQQSTHGKKSNEKLVRAVPLIAIVVICSGLSFIGGMQYQDSKGSTTPSQDNRPSANTGMFGLNDGNGPSRMMFRGSLGVVTAISTTSITINSERTGKIETYSIANSTKIIADGNSASTSDIKTGDTVMVQTSGGNETVASQIVINPNLPDNGNGGPQSMQLQTQ